MRLGLPALERPPPRRRRSPARATLAVEEPREHGGKAVRPEAVARGREVQEVVHELDGQILRAILRATTGGAARHGHAALVELLLQLRFWQRDGAQQARAAVQHADLVKVGGEGECSQGGG